MRILLSRRQVLQASVALTGLGLLVGCTGQRLPWPLATRVTRIGYLGGGSSEPYRALLDGFRQELHALGYVEGESILIEYRFTDSTPERAPAFAAELVGLNPDLIVANGGVPVAAAKAATTTIPIVGVPLGGDPVGTGLVVSLARPGGNVTGLSTVAGGTIAKRLQLLREAVPSISRAAVLWNAINPVKAAEYKEAQVVAESLGLELLSTEVRGPNDFEGAFQAITSSRVDALVVLSETLTLAHSARIAAFTVERRLPSIYETREFADAGGLMSYGLNLADLFRRAATYVDRILKGTRPGDLPVEQPTKFDLALNLRTAQGLGLMIPPSILQQATAVIQ